MNAGDRGEKVLTLAYPLPLSVVPDLLRAIGEALEEAGWTDVRLSADDGAVYARTPQRSRSDTPL